MLNVNSSTRNQGRNDQRDGDGGGDSGKQRQEKHWVSQQFFFGFSIIFCGKTGVNSLANPIE